MSKRNTFYGAAAILTVSTILVKIIGAIFKIPLIAILPEEAYGDFNGAYNIYSFFLTISTAGLPVALSKTVSECHTLGRENQKRQVFRMAFGAFLFMGLFSFICMSLFGQIVATYVIGNEKAVFCVWALAPAVLCTCCCSAFRGYAQGHMNMLPTAISQIIEALCKLVLGLGLAMLIMRLTIWPDDIRNQMAASGALIGVSFGSILSVLYLAFNHVRTRRRESTPATDRADRGRTVLVRLLKLAIPITLSSCSMSLVTIIDTNLVNNQLQSVFTAIQGGLAGIENSFLDIFPKAVQVFAENVAAQQADLFSQLMTAFREGTAAADFGTTLDPILDSARSLYGTYSKTMSVYNLPFNLMIPLTACIVPGISACLARRDGLGAQRITESAMRMAALIALPCGFGLMALGGPIMEVIALGNVDTGIAGPILSILGIASIFVCFQLVGTAILQANGIVNLPIITVIIGGVTKIVVNYTLVGNPKIMIFGAPVGTLCCFAVISTLNLLIIKRAVPHPPRYLVALGKPLLASVIMAAAAWGSHGLLSRVLYGSLGKDMLATAGAILVGVVVYAVLVLALRTLTHEDLEMMPGGKKLAKILHIR